MSAAISTPTSRNGSSKSFICQDLANATSIVVDPPKKIFRNIGWFARTGRIDSLENLAFRANRNAKATIGATQDAWYSVKSKAMSALVEIGAAIANGDQKRITGDLVIGVTFIKTNRKLHAHLSRLDDYARTILERELGLSRCFLTAGGGCRW